MTASLLDNPKNRFDVLAAFADHAFSSSYHGDPALRDTALLEMRQATALLEDPLDQFKAQQKIVSFYPWQSLKDADKDVRLEAVQKMYAACSAIKDPSQSLSSFFFAACNEPVPAEMCEGIFEKLYIKLLSLPVEESSFHLGLRFLATVPRLNPGHKRTLAFLTKMADALDTETSFKSVGLHAHIISATATLRKNHPEEEAYDEPFYNMYEAAKRYPRSVAFNAFSNFLEVTPYGHPLYVEALQDLIAASPAMDPQNHTPKNLRVTSQIVLSRLEEVFFPSKELYKPLSRTALSNTLLLAPFLNNHPEYELKLYTIVAKAASSDEDIRRNAVVAMASLGQKIETTKPEKNGEESALRFPLKQAFFAYNTALHYISPDDPLVPHVTQRYLALAARKEMFNPYPYPFFNELAYGLEDKKSTLLRGVASEALIAQSSFLHRLNPLRDVMCNATAARVFALDFQKMIQTEGTPEDKKVLQQGRKLYHTCKP